MCTPYEAASLQVAHMLMHLVVNPGCVSRIIHLWSSCCALESTARDPPVLSGSASLLNVRMLTIGHMCRLCERCQM